MRYTVFVTFIVFMLSATAPANAHIKPFFAGAVSVDIISDRGTVFQSFLYQELKRGETWIIKKYLEAKKGENLRDCHQEQHPGAYRCGYRCRWKKHYIRRHV